MAPPVKVSRNKPLVRGVGRFSRSKMYHKRGLWALKQKHGGSFPSHDKVAAPEPKESRAPKFYPADDVKQPLRKKKIINLPRLRASISPGTVLILLAGRFKGKRVVFLKQLESGLLLITGPFTVNGVPLRRVDQNYVIATSTKLDIGSSVDLTKYTDAYFAKEVVKKKKGESEFFEADPKEKEKKEVPEGRKGDQKSIDGALLSIIDKTPEMKAYLGARFSLKSGVKPHEIVF